MKVNMRSIRWRAAMYGLNRVQHNTTSGDDRTMAAHYVEQLKKDDYSDKEVFEFIGQAEENLVNLNPR